MAYRNTLLTRLTTVLSSYNQFSLSSELPFVAGNTPLYVKNMKTVYVDEEQVEVSEFIPTLDNRTIFQSISIIRAYVTVDAKNKPSQTDNMLAAIEAAKSIITPVVNVETVLSTEIQDDIIIYSLEYRFLTI